MNETNPELKNVIEAALLVAGQPLTIDKMLSMFPEDSRPAREEIRAVLEALAAEYESRGIEVRQIDKSWRIQTRGRYSPYIQKLLEERPPRYSRALLETLAIIVYRQPVTRGDIEDIRGVAVSSEIMRTLVEREWVREVGRREVPGRPALYGTTREFLEHFNLASLSDLPPLSELRPIEEIGAELDKRLAEQTGGGEAALAGDTLASAGGEGPAGEAGAGSGARARGGNGGETKVFEAEREAAALEARPSSGD
jgi:segregation and condensation protein B